MDELPKKLLAADEPAPVMVYNADGESLFVLVADHAGNIMPRALRHLGIAEAECERHIALDIGIAGLGRLLADALDAMLIQQNYSQPRASTAIARWTRRTSISPTIGGATRPIPGNVELEPKAARVGARRRNLPALSPTGSRPSWTAGGKAGRPGGAASRCTAFTPVFEGRSAALACRRALQSRSALSPVALMALLNAEEGLHRRRQRAVHR